MPNKVLLALSQRPGLQAFITNRRPARAVAYRFVAGDDLAEGMRAVAELKAKGIDAILDYLGENVTTSDGADHALGAYSGSLDAIETAGTGTHISVKLTQLGLALDLDGCLARMEKLVARAGEVGTVVAIDMESHEFTDRTIETYRRLRAGHDNVVLCLQSYLRRTEDDLASLLPLRPSIRLCKGAYNEPRTIAYRRGETRRAFRRLLAVLLDRAPYTAIATHDESLVDEASLIAKRHAVPKERYEFQMLFGVRRELQERLVAEGHPVRTYIPFGDQWYPYLMRRLAERPANLRFFLEALFRR